MRFRQHANNTGILHPKQGIKSYSGENMDMHPQARQTPSSLPSRTKRNPLILICLAGLLDIVTTFFGVNFFGLQETNLINRLYFPLGIFVWVCWAIGLLYLFNRLKLPKYEKLTKQILTAFTVAFVYVAPVNNLILITGA